MSFMEKKLNIKAFLVPLICVALIVISNSPILTYISIKLKADGIPKSIIGLNHSFFYGGFVIGSFIAEKFIKKLGFSKTFTIFTLGYLFSIIVQSLYINVYFWFPVRLVSGLCIGLLYIVIESWLVIDSTSLTRGRILSVYMLVFYASQSFSQVLIKFVNIHNLSPFYLFGSIGVLALVPIIVLKKPKKMMSEELEHNFKLKNLIISAPFASISAFIAGLILSSIYSFTPIYASDNHLIPHYLTAATIAGGFVFQWPIGLLSDKINRKRVLRITALLLLFPSLIMFLLPYNKIFIYSLSFLIGGLGFTIYPLCITNACDKVSPQNIPFALGTLAFLYGIGAMLGPTISAIFMKHSSSGMYLFLAFCAFFIFLFGFVFKKDKCNFNQN
ncbi:MAG: putative MFS-type transporter YcaD [Candidatus Anoxychlamydiales bacterium]|nr:putative MFS-type transporter YcaD [Candidatus Anoxychlamydiales bacterium]